MRQRLRDSGVAQRARERSLTGLHVAGYRGVLSRAPSLCLDSLRRHVAGVVSRLLEIRPDAAAFEQKTLVPQFFFDLEPRNTVFGNEPKSHGEEGGRVVETWCASGSCC